jgi:hypothetical protein
VLGDLHISSEAFLVLFLPTLLFESALAVDVRRLMNDIAPILVMAVIAVVVGASGIFRRPGPLLAGLYIATGIMGVLSMQDSFPLYSITFGGVSGQAGPGTERSGLGIVVMYAGFFGVIVAGVAAALARSRSGQS